MRHKSSVAPVIMAKSSYVRAKDEEGVVVRADLGPKWVVDEGGSPKSNRSAVRVSRFRHQELISCFRDILIYL